jgi:acid stress chaperone HdeB
MKNHDKVSSLGAGQAEESEMKKLAIIVALTILSAPLAKAEVVDVSTIKCSDLGKMSKDEASYILIWLHGYYGGKAGDTTIDLAALESAGTAIGEKCGENPDLGLMTAITQLTAQ